MEKRSEKKMACLIKGKTSLWDVVLVNLISLMFLLLPFAHYRYKKADHLISGLQFLTGTGLQNGEVTLTPNLFIIMTAVLSAASILLAAGFPKIKKIKVSGFLLCLFSFIQVVFLVLFASGIETTLSEVKKPGISFGIAVEIILSILVIIRCLQILYSNNVLSMLDFMILPGALYLFVNNYCPMAGLALAFKKVDYSVGFLKSPWVGFDNFKYLFSTKDAFIMTRNTILYNVAFIIIGNIMGILVGLFLSELFSSKLQKFFQTAILLPQMISYIIVAYIVFAFLSNEAGMITKIITSKGGMINFYNSPKYWPFIIIIVNTWKGLGYSAVMYLAAILGIDKSLYEAAYVDGATRRQRIFRITLPLLKRLL